MAELLRMRQQFAVESASFTHVGGRLSNQDALQSVSQEQLSCHIVADGAGGHAQGELAARLVVESIAEEFDAAPGFSVDHIRHWFQQATRRVTRRQEEPDAEGMSATCALLLLDMTHQQALWGHLGDTRIYFFRHQKVQALTKDHSLVQQFIDAGYCSAEESRVHPQRHVLYAAIGAEGDASPAVTEQPMPLLQDDAFLICSDGLWEWIDEGEMERTLSAAADVKEWLERMKEVADQNASRSGAVRDNTTAIALWIRSLPGSECSECAD